MPLVLGFAAVAVAVLLLSSGITGDPLADVLKGGAKNAYDKDLEDESSSSSSSSTPATDTSAAYNAQGKLEDVKKDTSATYNAQGKLEDVAPTFPTYTGQQIAGGGFAAVAGTQQTEGVVPQITADLNQLGKKLDETIVGISGYRTPAHSVEVGGSANDPHTKGLAEDIGVNGETRSSAASITETELASVGLWRPFDPSDDPSNVEVNHVELLGDSN